MATISFGGYSVSCLLWLYAWYGRGGKFWTRSACLGSAFVFGVFSGQLLGAALTGYINVFQSLGLGNYIDWKWVFFYGVQFFFLPLIADVDRQRRLVADEQAQQLRNRYS